MAGAAGASPPIRVVVVDDHALFRRGIELVLAEDSGIEIVGEAENGVEAIALADRLVPDVMLMDVRMPEANGIEATRAVRANHPEVKVIMLTVSDEERDLIESVKAGASGYLLKELAIEEVPDAIRAVADGQSLISPSMATKLLVEFNALARRADERSVSAAPRLTDRELEVLAHVAKGQSNRRIGEELFIAENTVKNHVRNILEKLHLHSRTEAVAYAIREKLLDIEQGR